MLETNVGSALSWCCAATKAVGVRSEQTMFLLGHTITEQFVCAKHKHAIVDETKRRLALRVKGR